MTIEQAIQKAIESGFPIYGKTDVGFFEEFSPVDWAYEFLLDPEFWQSLGKAMGWAEKQCVCNGYSSQCACDPQWLNQQHELIDHIADGGTIESYFEKL